VFDTISDNDANAGDVVLAGSFTRPTNAARGGTLPADDGLLGSISCRFV
jgi:2-oxo-hept-3-ene-1,7-dioate hydratase